MSWWTVALMPPETYREPIDGDYLVRLPQLACEACGATWGGAGGYVSIDMPEIVRERYCGRSTVSNFEWREICELMAGVLPARYELWPGSGLGAFAAVAATRRLPRAFWAGLGQLGVTRALADFAVAHFPMVRAGCADIVGPDGAPLEAMLLDMPTISPAESSVLRAWKHCGVCGRILGLPYPNIEVAREELRGVKIGQLRSFSGFVADDDAVEWLEGTGLLMTVEPLLVVSASLS